MIGHVWGSVYLQNEYYEPLIFVFSTDFEDGLDMICEFMVQIMLFSNGVIDDYIIMLYVVDMNNQNYIH